jgi:hypothetical protein
MVYPCDKGPMRAGPRHPLGPRPQTEFVSCHRLRVKRTACVMRPRATSRHEPIRMCEPCAIRESRSTREHLPNAANSDRRTCGARSGSKACSDHLEVPIIVQDAPRPVLTLRSELPDPCDECRILIVTAIDGHILGQPSWESRKTMHRLHLQVPSHMNDGAALLIPNRGFNTGGAPENRIVGTTKSSGIVPLLSRNGRSAHDCSPAPSALSSAHKLACLKNPPGVVPVCLRKESAKWLWLENPTDTATSATEMFPILRSAFDLSIRAFRMY